MGTCVPSLHTEKLQLRQAEPYLWPQKLRNFGPTKCRCRSRKFLALEVPHDGKMAAISRKIPPPTNTEIKLFSALLKKNQDKPHLSGVHKKVCGGYDPSRSTFAPVEDIMESVMCAVMCKSTAGAEHSSSATVGRKLADFDQNRNFFNCCTHRHRPRPCELWVLGSTSSTVSYCRRPVV